MEPRLGRGGQALVIPPRLMPMMPSCSGSISSCAASQVLPVSRLNAYHSHKAGSFDFNRIAGTTRTTR